MANSGSFSKGIGSYYTFRVDWSAAQQQAANKSVVTFRMYLVGHNIGSASTAIGARSGNAAAVNGASYTWDAAAVSETGSFTKLLGSREVTVYHENDGSKTFAASFTYAIKFTTGGNYVASVTASGQITPDTIPRASAISLSPASQTLGSDIGVTISRASADFTHSLSYAFQGMTGTIAEKTALTSLSWTLPDSFGEKFTDKASLDGEIICVTHAGDKTVGRVSAPFTARLSAANAPVITAVTVSPVDSPEEFSSLFVQKKSRAAVGIEATGETALSYEVTLDGKTYQEAAFTSSVLASSGELTLAVTVKDARGLKTTVSKSITVLPYGAPYLIPAAGETSVRLYRADAAGAPSATGNCVALRGGRTQYVLNGENRAGVSWSYRKASETEYSVPMILSPESAGQTVYFDQVLELSLSDAAYCFRLEVRDRAGGVQKVDFDLPRALPTLHLKPGGLGAAFGKYAENDSLLDSAWPLKAPGMALEEALAVASGGTGAKTPEAAVASLTGQISRYLAPGESFSFTAASPKSVYFIFCTDRHYPGAWIAGGGNVAGSSYAVTVAASSLMTVTAGGASDPTVTLENIHAQYNAHFIILRLA